MPRLRYRATNFPAAYGPALAGSQALVFAWPEMVWAAISVGRSELFHLFRHGAFSAFEIVYRAAILFANLRENDETDLTRSDAYDGLDPSEKGAVSYFMGLTAAKLFAERLLDVPWLMHLDVYREELQPLLQGTGKPDLVGRNRAGAWIAIESKGRTNGHDSQAMTRAKEQVSCLARVNGQQLALRVALLAHFADGVLQCAVDDPEGEGRKRSRRINLPLSEEKLLEGYYRPFREWLQEAPNARIEEVSGERFVIADTPDVDLSIGLQEEVVVRRAPQGRRVPTGQRAERRRDAETEYLGTDGLLIRVGELWSVENMKRQPQERQRG